MCRWRCWCAALRACVDFHAGCRVNACLRPRDCVRVGVPSPRLAVVDSRTRGAVNAVCATARASAAVGVPQPAPVGVASRPRCRSSREPSAMRWCGPLRAHLCMQYGIAIGSLCVGYGFSLYGRGHAGVGLTRTAVTLTVTPVTVRGSAFETRRARRCVGIPLASVYPLV